MTTNGNAAELNLDPDLREKLEDLLAEKASEWDPEFDPEYSYRDEAADIVEVLLASPILTDEIKRLAAL